jgi:hypothetical protein
MSYLRRSLVSLVILACLTQLAFVTPALAQRAKAPKQDRLSRVMDPTTDVEEFRQEYTNYMSEFEHVVELFSEIPAVRKRMMENGANPLETLGEAKLWIASASPEDLRLVRATYTKFPGWRDAPQGLEALIKPEFHQKLEVRLTKRKGGAEFVPLAGTTDDCEDGLDADVSNTDISIAKAAELGLLAVMEGFPTDALTIAARIAPIALAAAAQIATLTLETLKGIKDDCNGDSFETAIKNQVTNSTTSILNKVDSAKTAIVDKIDSAKTTILDKVEEAKNTVAAKVDANAAAIMDNDNANRATIVTNANANKNELRDLILRTQIEADLAQLDSNSPVALYLTPTAKGGYLDLVQTIVTQTLANILAGGGDVSGAQSYLTQANTAKTAGQFKNAYALYRKAYKAAAK